MVDQVLASLIASENEAADDVLLEALRVGEGVEKTRALDALLQRKTPTGIFGLLLQFKDLSHELRLVVLQRSDDLYHQLPEAGRSDDPQLRQAAIRVIALARLGKLSYVLSENLHHPDDTVATAAADALVSLSRHVASETRRLQGGLLDEAERRRSCRRLMEIRADIDAAVYRALDLHKGAKAQDLLRAALLLCDHAGSKTLGILSTSRHGGVSPMVKRLQQTPDAEHVDAFLLGVTHGQLRSQLAVSFASIEAAPVLDALIRRTYFLKDHRLELGMRQVSRAAWLTDTSLIKDLTRRDASEAALVAEWIGLSGTHDVVQDEKLIKVFEHVRTDPIARLKLLRIAIRRPRGASLSLLRRFLDDPDETLQRIAAREIVRRKPADYSSVLLGLMKSGPLSVRRVASRAISAGAFENFYDRFDRLDEPTRARAGKAVFKLLPDAVLRLSRKLSTGTPEQRLKALTVAQELQLADSLREAVLQLTGHDNAKVRSKAVSVAGTLTDAVPEMLLERALTDPDARVRANAIEVLELTRRDDFVPLLAQRARAANNRERANAIKALHSLKVNAALPQLMLMLRDPRPEHRISALWAARHVGMYRMLTEVVQLTKIERDPKVRRYAEASARLVARLVREQSTPQSDPTHPQVARSVSSPLPRPSAHPVTRAVSPPPPPTDDIPAFSPSTTLPAHVPVGPARPGMARVYRPGRDGPDPASSTPPQPEKRAG
jgi:HEAT repeat protein